MPHTSETGPRAVIIVLSSFLTHAVVYGISTAIGLYTVELQNYFDASALHVSLVGAINMCMFRLGGPVVNILLRKYGHRCVCITGAIFSTIGVFSMAFAKHIAILWVTYGLIGGFGFCMCFISTLVLVGVHFKKYQAIACGISGGGGGVGVVVLPMFINFLIDKYAWRGSFLVLSGMCLNVVVLGALPRSSPRAVITQRLPTVSDEARRSVNNDIITCQKESQELHQEKAMSNEGYTPRETVTKSKSSQRSKIVHFVKMNFKVLNNLGFILYAMSFSLYSFTMAVFYNFAPAFFVGTGLDESDAASLLSLSTVVYCPASIAAGILGNTRFVNRKALHIVAVTVMAADLILHNYLQTKFSLSVLAVVLGGCNAAILVSRVVIITEIVGIEYLSDAVGFNALFTGIAFLAGPPAAGYLYDATGSFDAMFYCAFTAACLAIITMLIIPVQKTLTRGKYYLNNN